MPQLTAYYWLSQITWSLFALGFLTIIFAFYILPPILEQFVSRIYITKI